ARGNLDIIEREHPRSVGIADLALGRAKLDRRVRRLAGGGETPLDLHVVQFLVFARAKSRDGPSLGAGGGPRLSERAKADAPGGTLSIKCTGERTRDDKRAHSDRLSAGVPNVASNPRRFVIWRASRVRQGIYLVKI